MTPQQQREEISKAYLAAVAARCAFKVANWSQDDDCLDATIAAAGTLHGGILASPKLDVQLKCSNDQRHDQGDRIACSLKRAHYDALRVLRCTPIILVLVMLPEREEDWVTCSPESLILRRCGYWHSLRGLPELAPEVDSTTIKIPAEKRFSPETLVELMQRIAAGAEP